MRVVQLVCLLVVGACARRDIVPPVRESALVRFIKHPFGLGLDDSPTIEDPDVVRTQYCATTEPLYLQTLNRSRARDETLSHQDSAFVNFLKHPFGLGYKDPVEEHIQEPFRKHIKRPIERGINKLESNDPLHLKSTRQSVKDAAQYGSYKINDSALVRFLKHPFGIGLHDPIKEHITGPVKRNVVDPVKHNVVDPVKESLRSHKDPIHEYVTDPIRKNVVDPVKDNIVHPAEEKMRELGHAGRNAAHRATHHGNHHGTKQVEKAESSIVRFFKHPFGWGRKDPVHKDRIHEYVTDPIRKNVVDPVKDNIVHPAEEKMRELGHASRNAAHRATHHGNHHGTKQVEKAESSIAGFFKHPFGWGRRDPVQHYITDPAKEYVVDPVKKHVTDPVKENVRKLEHGDLLNTRSLKRKVSRKLSNEDWAHGRDPVEQEQFSEIEETLLATE